MTKKITVIGTGYVGLITAVGLADFGNEVIGVDIDEEKINKLQKGIRPIYEPGVDEYLKRNIEAGRLTFSTDLEGAIKKGEVIFIAVGTPAQKNGEVDLKHLNSVVDSIACNINDYKVIVIKSTVPVGTNQWIKEKLREKAPDKEFDVVSNPEFLRAGRAIQDFFHPDRVVIGYETEKAKKVLEQVYRSLNLISVPFVWCNIETAELIKYASNAFLATKITFINQIANLAETVGADVHKIAKTMGMDGRISGKFLHAGPGYGGSCFPKDTKALVSIGEKYKVDMSLVREVIHANDMQQRRMVDKLLKLMPDGIKGKTVGLLGLAFKQETDDIRDSPALTIAGELLKGGARIQAFDPKAMENFAKEFPDILYCHSAYDAAKNADALVICTEWNEFRNLDLEIIGNRMKNRVILDTRNLLDPAQALQLDFEYDSVGRRKLNKSPI